MPKFSIVTVTLNPGSDLKTTLFSVLNQDYLDWELIVKDGGSSDGSLTMVPDDQRIRVVRSKDKGAFDAMNQALQFVSGDYVCFLNAGDYLMDKGVLSVVLAATEKNSKAEFLYGDVHKPLSRSQYELYPDQLSRFYLYNNFICHQCWFVKSLRYKTNGGFEIGCQTGGDYRYFLRMLIRDRVEYHHIAKVIVNYKGGGLSSKNDYQLTSKKWNDELKLELFSRYENLAYSSIWKARGVIKRVVYDDPLLYKLWKIYQKIRVHRRAM